MSTPHPQPYHPQQPPQAPPAWGPPQTQAPWAAQPVQPQAPQAQVQQGQTPWASQAAGHSQQYALVAPQAQLAQQQQAYQAYQAQQQQASQAPQQDQVQQRGYAPPTPSATDANQPQTTGFRQTASGYAAALPDGQGTAGWMNSLVAGGLASEEPPAANLKKGLVLALLSVPLGMVLAAGVSYVTWMVSVPKLVFLAPGAVAGFAAVWLFMRKADHVSTKGLVGLVAVGAVAAVCLVAAAVATDMFYASSQGWETTVGDILKSNARWYALFVVANFGGLFGALRKLRS